MKTISLVLLSCCLYVVGNAQNGISTIASDGSLTDDLEVKVDGKSYAIIPAAVRNSSENTIAINNLRPGSHVIQLVPLSEKPLFDKPLSEKPEAFISPETLVPLPNRLSVVQEQIVLTPEEKDSIQIEFYDNGFIDNDTISVYRDDQAVLQNKRVSGQPLRFLTGLENGQKVQRIKMEAQNLGTIAPNTALMIVTTRKAKYSIPLTGDLSRNAVVEFLLKE